MSTKSKRARKKSSDELVVRLADLEAENAEDFRIRDAANARITARNKLIEAAAALAKLTPRKARPKTQVPSISKLIYKDAAAGAQPKPARVNGDAAKPPPHQPAPPSRKGTGSMAIVMEVLRDSPDGLTAADIKRKAATIPDASKSLTQHGQYIYSVLDILKGRHLVVKDSDGKWKVAAPPTAGAH